MDLNNSRMLGTPLMLITPSAFSRVALWLDIGACILLSPQRQCRTSANSSSHFGTLMGAWETRENGILSVMNGMDLKHWYFVLFWTFMPSELQYEIEVSRLCTAINDPELLTFQCVTSWML